MSALENETTGDDIKFEHFGRTWSVPARRHLSHLRRLRDEGRRGWASPDLILIETFLNEGQIDDLLDIDPDEVELAKFGEQIAKALGFGSAGNSASS